MKSVVMLMAALVALSGSAHAARSFDSYEAFYAAQPGTVFDAPIKQPAGPLHLYSDLGGQGSYTELRSTLDGKAVRIEVAENRITVNGKVLRYSSAVTFPGEHPSDIYPPTADVFLASRTNDHPAVLCLQGWSDGSGEADRYAQIYLLLNPLAPKSKVMFLHLPSLLSSCRAVLAAADGKLAFPKNSYLFDNVQESRIGLLVSYYTFENQRFVSTPVPKQLQLRFTHPEIPFQFSVIDKD